MPRKKKDETVEETNGAVEVTEATDDATEEVEAKNASADESEASVFDSVIETVASAVETVAETVASGVSSVVNAIAGTNDAPKKELHSKRAEKIGTVSSDKMTKTVVVRVDRVVKHPMYRKYIKRRKKFMAHDETGASIGDKVRIIETRPLSARKRWRVVEIIQKAEK